MLLWVELADKLYKTHNSVTVFFVLRLKYFFYIGRDLEWTHDKMHYSTLNRRAIFPIAPQGQS